MGLGATLRSWEGGAGVDGDILVASRDCEVRLDLKTPWISRLAIHPRDERRRIICARDVREGIPAADARIEINDAAFLLADKKIAIENADVAQVLADGLAELFESLVLYRHGAIGLPGAHSELSLRESADVATV